MRVLIFAVCLLILNACSNHIEQQQPIGAGIIAVACKDHSAFYLLARERDISRAGWGHLGGTHDGNEPLLATALREFHEESNCYFDLNHPRTLQLSGPSQHGNFTTYHMKVEYRPASEIAQSRVCQTQERDQWVWVRRTDLLSILQTNHRSLMVFVAEGKQQAVPLWNVAAGSLRQALIDKVIPEEDPCIPMIDNP